VKFEVSRKLLNVLTNIVLAIGVAIAKCYRVRNTTLSEKFLLKDGDRVSIPKSFVSKFDSIEQITDSITNGWTKNQNFINRWN